MNKEDTNCLVFEEAKKEAINKSVNIWANSKLNFLKSFGTDETGKWGENCFRKIVEEFSSYSVVWDGDSNTHRTDGIYDMLINNHRVEVKTAMKGTNYDTWQHDQIKRDKYDKIVFFDVTPEDKIYITILNNSDIPYDEKNILVNKRATSCKGGWKYDMSITTIKKYIELGNTYCYDLNNTINNINFDEFLKRHFINVENKTTT